MIETDPLAIWGKKEIVESFENAPPNAELLAFARNLMATSKSDFRVLDIGCGAGRNLLPLLGLGVHAYAVDMSPAMVASAKRRAHEAGFADRLTLALAPHDNLPFEDSLADLVIAHGVWNLARSDEEFERAISEATRLTRDGGSIFLFTFHRETIDQNAGSIDGQKYCFSNFAGYPQCFVDETELEVLLQGNGLILDRDSIKIFNRQAISRGPRILSSLPRNGAPVILQAIAKKTIKL